MPTDGVLVGVAGSKEERAATGFTADLDTGDLLNTWAPVMVGDLSLLI